MSLEIGSLKITKWDLAILPKAIDAIKQLPSLPVSAAVKKDPSKTLTVLERENAFVVVTPEIDSIATLDCRWCVFVVLRGKDKAGKNIALACHSDDAMDAGDRYMSCEWEKHLAQFDRQHPVDVWLVGGENEKESTKVLKNILKNLYALVLHSIIAQNKITIRITRQNVLENFRFKPEDYMRLCADYILLKARVAYRKLFDKPFPVELNNLTFDEAIPDPKQYKSVVPGFEKDLLTCRLEVLRIVSAGEESWDSINTFTGKRKIPVLEKYAKSFMEVSPEGLTNWLLFCEFIFSAAKHDELSRTFFQMQIDSYAGSLGDKSGEEMFVWRLKRLFSLPLGYDAVRWLVICSGVNQAIKYSQFTVSLQDGTISPVTNRFHDIPHYALRIGRIVDMKQSISFVYCCDHRGEVSEPKLSPAFLRECEQYKSYFEYSQKSKDKAIDTAKLKQICAEMRIPEYGWEQFERFMRHYANPPKMLVRAPEPAPAPQNPARVEAALVNKLTPPKKAEAKTAGPEKSTRSKLQGGWFK